MEATETEGAVYQVREAPTAREIGGSIRLHGNQDVPLDVALFHFE